ncbi:MAG TPA: hypothetical protein VE993_10940, partial [Stellaceae bacterium]|nr:hypothetical protein [Stellaceae bacterium]
PTRTTRDLPAQGSIIRYPYLWASQRDRTETEGRKPRPVCLVLRIRDPKEDIHHLVLLAISSQPPHSDQQALEIPDTERRRGGLTRCPRAWVVVSEYNYDIAERSWHFEPHAPPLGSFSTPFLREIAIALRSSMRRAGARVDRTV